MAQFDSLIIFSLSWSLLLTLFLHYNVLFSAIIPDFFSIKKFRGKKYDYLSTSTFFKIKFTN